MDMKEKNFGNIIGVLSILVAFLMIYKWKEYEQKVISEAKTPAINSISYENDISIEKAEKIDLLEKMAIIKEAIKKKPKVIWLQEGIHNEEAEKLARDAGIDVVYNRCMLAEHRRLS